MSYFHVTHTNGITLVEHTTEDTVHEKLISQYKKEIEKKFFFLSENFIQAKSEDYKLGSASQKALRPSVRSQGTVI